MTSEESSKLERIKKAEEMRFMLWIGSGWTMDECCFCFSLKIGCFLIIAFVLSFKIPFYFSTYYYFTLAARIPIIVFDIFSSIAYIVLLIGVINEHFEYAYWAYLLSAWAAYAYILGGLIIVVLQGTVFGIINLDPMIKQFGFTLIYAIFIVAYLGNIIGWLFNHFFTFCYAKYLGLGRLDIINGEKHNSDIDQTNQTEDTTNYLIDVKKEI